MNISRRNFLSTSASIAGTAILSALRAQSVYAEKLPNIIFIDTDDQAQWAVGVYGNNDIYTPNMDRLAQEGMKFTRAFTTPVCSPSRAMVMTGFYGNQVGVEEWIHPEETFGIAPGVTTLGDILKEAGYNTGYIGKWHIGKEAEYHPLNRGFNYFMGFLEGGNKPMNPILEVGGKKQQVEGYLTDILADDAVSFLRANRTQPFALFFHTRAPHAPYAPVPDVDNAHYEGKTFSLPETKDFSGERLHKLTREYYASISSVDRNIGRLLDELKILGLEENTIVIFTGDNGYNIGQHNHHHKGNGMVIGTRDRRPNMWDTSCMVPLIIRWPGMVKPGSVCDAPVSSLDYIHTFAEITGLKHRLDTNMEGMSMVRLLAEKKPVIWRDTIFGVYDMHHGAIAHMRMIRTDDWKLVMHFEEGGKHELYDLNNDPGELYDLYDRAKVKEIQKQLEQRLRAWGKKNGIKLDR